MRIWWFGMIIRCNLEQQLCKCGSMGWSNCRAVRARIIQRRGRKNARIRDAPAQRGLSESTSSTCIEGSTDFVLHGVDTRLHPFGKGVGSVVVRDGKIACTGECEAETQSCKNAFVLNLTCGHHMPVSVDL